MQYPEVDPWSNPLVQYLSGMVTVTMACNATEVTGVLLSWAKVVPYEYVGVNKTFTKLVTSEIPEWCSNSTDNANRSECTSVTTTEVVVEYATLTATRYEQKGAPLVELPFDHGLACSSVSPEFSATTSAAVNWTVNL